MKKLLLSLLLLSSSAVAQDVQFGVIGPFGGLNNTDNSVIISENAAQDLLNVDITPGGKSVKKRQGYAQSLELSNTTSAVHGVHSFYDSSGDTVVLAFNDVNVTASIANGTPTVIYSTATNGVTWQCVDTQGFAYCVNTGRDALFYTEGETMGTISVASTGSIVAITPERLVQAGFTTTPNRIDFSAANDFETWTVGGDPTDPVTFTITAPGSRITHIVYAHKRIYWFKENSFGYILEGDTLADWTVRSVSNDIGTIDNTSALDDDGNLYFRGQDGHIYVTDGANVSKLSRDIEATISVSGNRTTNSWTQTSSSDFSNGYQNTESILSTTTDRISFISNPRETDTTDGNFLNGDFVPNITTTTVGGEIIRKWYLIDDWNDGDYTSFKAWTVDSGGWTVASSELKSNSGTTQAISTPYTQTAGTWEVLGRVADDPTGFPAWGVWFMAGTYQGTDSSYGYESYASGYLVMAVESGGTTSLNLFKSNSSGVLTLIGSSTFGFDIDVNHKVRITRTSAGVINVYWDGTLKITQTDTTNTTSTNVAFTGYAPFSVTQIAVDDFYYSPVVDATTVPDLTQAVFESQVFDNTAAIKSYDYFNATLSTSTGYTINFYTATSDDGSTFDPYILVATGAGIPSTVRRYIKYKAVFNNATDLYSATPVLYDVTLGRTLYAGYRSEVHNASSLSAWNSFYTTKDDGGGAFTFYIRASSETFAVDASSPAWTTVTDGGTPSISTGSYFQILSSFTVTSSDQDPILYDFTQSWYEGTASDKSYAQFYDDKVYFAVASGLGQATNNRVLVYDLLSTAWTLYDWPVSGFYRQGSSLYFGSANGGYVYKYGDTDFDDGADINAYWKSKDFFMGSPFLDKELANISLVADSVVASSITVTYTVNGAYSNSYTVPLGIANTFARSNKNIAGGKTGAVFNIQFGNDASDQPFEVFAIQYGYRTKSWKPE